MNGDLSALKDLSARIGADAALVQAAGGNTSLKQDGLLWIKASGTWLMHASSQDIMVPVALAPLMAAFDSEDPAAENAKSFVPADQNPSNLRPSIETTLHSVLQHRIVLHVHCVETIAVAVRQDAEEILSRLLTRHRWAFVPYIRPGPPLSRAMAARITPETNVVILGNHGLVVAADTVAEAEALLRTVAKDLHQTVRPAPPPDLDALARLSADSAYRLPQLERAHAVACDPVSCRIASGGSIYPDHVIFLGAGSVVAGAGETAEQVRTKALAAG
ncbi:MAG: class II aldolase/adducin family protein, partial [Alphaproteobacteria bacterium]